MLTIVVLIIIFGQIHPYFGQVQRLMFVDVKFRSSSNVNIRRCEFV